MKWPALPAHLGRHQALGVMSGIVDFSTMFALVELAKVRPSLGTIGGCVAGGVFNFLLSRWWVFPGAKTGSPLGHQILRYSLVSGASALLNAAGVEAGTRMGLPYGFARVLTAAAVSLGWNYPMHRRLVFRGDAP
jgi:putative flippase GtrA